MSMILETERQLKEKLGVEGWHLTTKTTWKKYCDEYIFRADQSNRVARVREYRKIRDEVGLPFGYYIVPNWFIVAGC